MRKNQKISFVKIIISVFLVTSFLSCSGKRPANLGATEGRLLSCPDKPNCVSSQETRPDHKVGSFAFKGDREASKTRLKGVVAKMGGELIEEKEDYLYYEFTSNIFKFVDDVEFFFDSDSQVIHVRSASRVGHSDLGVNKKRVQKIEFKYVQF